MAIVSARLEADGLTTLLLDPYSGYVISALDLGDAETRDVVDPAVDADGTDDTTEFTGARTIILQVQLVPSSTRTKQSMRTRLRAFTHPRLRPVLYFQLDDEVEQRVELRRSQWSNIVQNAGFAAVVVQWVAPNGIIESATLHDVTANASGTGSEGGRTYSKTYDKTYTGGAIVGSASVVNAGTADVYPLLRVYGPCTDPTIENITTGKELVFAALTINAGDFLEVDTRARTIRYNGDPADSRYDKLDFPGSEWWALSPGTNLVRLNPVTFSSPSNLVVEYRDAWL
jgi:hypothetical protein